MRTLISDLSQPYCWRDDDDRQRADDINQTRRELGLAD